MTKATYLLGLLLHPLQSGGQGVELGLTRNTGPGPLGVAAHVTSSAADGVGGASTTPPSSNSKQMNVHAFTVYSRQGHSNDLLSSLPILRKPVLPEVAHSFFWPFRRDDALICCQLRATRHCKSETHRGECGLRSSATTDNSYTTCRQDHCVFTVTNVTLLILTMTHDRSPFIISNDICTRLAGRLHSVSAREAVRRFVFPPFLACPRSSRGVDLLAVHSSRLILERDAPSFVAF